MALNGFHPIYLPLMGDCNERPEINVLDFVKFQEFLQANPKFQKKIHNKSRFHKDSAFRSLSKKSAQKLKEYFAMCSGQWDL